MSGTPKYSQAQLNKQRQKELERQRQIKAQEEAKKRAEAAERKEQEQLETLRNKSLTKNQEIARLFEQEANKIYHDDAQKLKTASEKLRENISHTKNITELRKLNTENEQLLNLFNQAISRKRRDEEEKKRLDALDQQKFELYEVQKEFDTIIDSAKFDEEGNKQVKKGLEEVKNAIAIGKPQEVSNPLAKAKTTLEKHQQQVKEKRNRWQEEKTAAEDAFGKLESLIAGLKEDVVVKRWFFDRIASLKQQAEVAKRAITSEVFNQPLEILTLAKTLQEEMIKEANERQIKADQRDYIANSIAQSLEQMGFFITYNQAQEPIQPASAIILGAASNSGKEISVKIPVDGSVSYEVDGYPKSIEYTVGGSDAAVCDEAEEKLNEMHEALEREFGVQMSEITWEDKDPHRHIKEAKPLQNSTEQTNYRKY